MFPSKSNLANPVSPFECEENCVLTVVGGVVVKRVEAVSSVNRLWYLWEVAVSATPRFTNICLALTWTRLSFL